MTRSCCMAFCLFLIAVVLPPVAVLMDDGCDAQFFLNIFLTLLGIIPGILHALWVCFVREKPFYSVYRV